MTIIDRLRASLRTTPRKMVIYECIQCGSTFTTTQFICPECGGKVERAEHVR